jgi:translation initiation factor 3 subunit H
MKTLFCLRVADTAKTSQGFISMKAYRLTPEAIKMYKENDFSPDYVKVWFGCFYDSLPLVAIREQSPWAVS